MVRKGDVNVGLEQHHPNLMHYYLCKSRQM